MSVLNPFRTTEQTILQDTDLAGPLVFCLTLGSFLLLVRTNNSILLIIIWKPTQKLEIIRFFFGAFIPHLQSGKVHFSYIYGIGVLGCLAFYALLTVMATQSSVTLGSVVSVLGYCLLPMVVLSGINVLIALQWVKTEFRYQFLFVSSAKIYNQYFNLSSRFFFCYRGTFGIVLAGLCILWCSASASKLFVTAYSMDHQQILVAYPCALLYGVFALITIF